MVVMDKTSAEALVYYKETLEPVRTARFSLKPVRMVEGRAAEKKATTDAVNVQIIRCNNHTFIQLEEDEAKKVQNHADGVLKKIQRVHKNVVWNLMVGRSFADKVQKPKQTQEEVNLDNQEDQEFDARNPKTWSEDSLEAIRGNLKTNQFPYDGFVVLFCVENDPKDNDVDYDEVAWELEKCLIYHFVRCKAQVLMNEEACMTRRGLEPVSRKSKTPGKKRNGYCVYLAYQLYDHVIQDQMIGEAMNKAVDLASKKKQLVMLLNEAKLAPQIDDRLRKSIKDIKEFLNAGQLNLVWQIKALTDSKSVDTLAQFVKILQTKNTGQMGLNQFLSFLSSSSGDAAAPSADSTPVRTASRLSMVSASPRMPTKILRGVSTLPRPTSSRSSTSTQDSQKMNGRLPQSSLPSIASTGSSTPETLRRQEHAASARRMLQTAKTTKLPMRTNTSSNVPSPSTSSPKRGHMEPPAQGRITREDLRKMNKSYPAPTVKKKQPVPRQPVNSSFSRTTIPMS